MRESGFVELPRFGGHGVHESKGAPPEERRGTRPSAMNKGGDCTRGQWASGSGGGGLGPGSCEGWQGCRTVGGGDWVCRDYERMERAEEGIGRVKKEKNITEGPAMIVAGVALTIMSAAQLLRHLSGLVTTLSTALVVVEIAAIIVGVVAIFYRAWLREHQTISKRKAYEQNSGYLE